MTTLNTIINHFKSTKKSNDGVPNLAKALKIERQAVYQWKGKIPKLRAYEIERITNGKFKAKAILKNNTLAKGCPPSG